ncbi:putative Ig domain-containing protein [Methanoregula sp. PtaU1.Bin006]|uniref:putative Ig domain-containing protein n=1 Tax=Methanoregula sp. PtaU1.Bin006 TaxID=1811681 RepID=UPI0025CF39F3|nr:putative Ig domain-containing protein [Methanoregula sp. PtaU1.Bin006]
MSNGPCFDLVEHNGYLYTGEGSEIRIYDVSTPDKISRLNWTSGVPNAYLGIMETGHFVNDLSADDRYLYITTEGRFIIADISSPAAPVILSSVDNTFDTYRYPMYATEIRGNYAYLSQPSKGIVVIDITNRAAPVIIRTVRLAGDNLPKRLTSSGQYLYVGMEGDKRMDILDLADPSRPVVVGSYAPAISLNTSTFSGVAVKDNVAYVAEYHWGVRAVDVSNPANPVEIGLLRGKEVNDINANDIKILGNYAFLSTRYEGVSIIDISNPRNLTIIGVGNDERTVGYTEGIHVTPKYTYIAVSTFGTGIYDTSVLTKPRLVANIPVNSGVVSIKATDNYAYLGAYNFGAWVMDVTDKTKPTLVGFVRTNGRNLGIDAQGNYVYVAGGWRGLSVLDVSNPASPKMVVENYGTSISQVLVDGSYAYTSVGIVDISNPLKPVYIAQPANFDDCSEFARLGDHYLIVVNGLGTKKGMYIYDITSKASPILVKSFNPGVSYAHVTVDGNIAVVTSGNDVITIDVSNVQNPVIRGKISYPGSWSARGITLDRDIPHTVYAVGGINDDIRAFDISDPANIRFIESVNLPGLQESINYHNGFIYAGGLYSGAYILSTTIQPKINRPPVIQEIGNKTVIAGRLLEFTITAQDPDNDSLSYSVQNLPANATFNSVTHTFSWIPGTNQAGNVFAPVFTVSDSNLSVSRTVFITVSLNRPPAIESISPVNCTGGTPLNFTVTASDPDGDSLNYSAENLPYGAAFNTSIMAFSWIPNERQIGSYNITFKVSDGFLTATTDALITVTAANQTNHPPVIMEISNKSVTAGKLLEFQVNASDPDGDLLNYSVENLPSGAAFNTSIKAFSWIPNEKQIGSYNVTFTASDGLLTNSTNASIIVSAADLTNHPPVIADLPQVSVSAGTPVSFTVKATDPDGDPLTYQMTMTPPGASFNPSTRVFTWTPQQAGTFAAQFVVSDGKTQAAKATYITVTGVSVTNHPPVIADLPQVSVSAGTPVSFTVKATDQDGDPLTYQMTMTPPGASFNPSTRVFTWTPQQAGTFAAQFVVSDGKTQAAKATYITVTGVSVTNHPPVIADLAPVTVAAGTPVSFTVKATDQDGDPLTYQMTMTPPGASFNPSTRVFTWTPQQAGTFAAQFVVSDGKTQAAKATYITVKDMVYYIQLE